MYTFQTNGRAQSLPKRSLGFISKTLFTSILLIGGMLNAQIENVYPSPVPLEDDDIIDIIVELGIASAPVQDIHSFSVVLQAEGFTMTAASNISFDATDGWLLGTGFTYDYSINSTGDEITINASRNDEVDQSGYGFVGKIGGIICDIDDEMAKNSSEPGLRMLEFRVNPSSVMALRIGPNPSSEYVSITHPQAKTIGSVQLYNLHGQLVKQWLAESDNLEISVSELKPGLYFLMSQESGVLRKQKILVRH